MTPEVKPTSAFLHLPIDILYSICDELPLSAKILLSQICKPMRHTLHGQCFAQLQAMARKDWCNTLTELADLLPNVYHCMSCDILHPVASHDIPDLTHCWCLRRRCHAVDMSDRLHPQQFYSISLYHVQLALKYSRMKSMHQDYRTNILKQYETRSVGSPVIKTLTAKPKVVNARFVLLATYVLYAGPVRDASTSDWGNYIVFCPHHLLGLSTRGGNEFAAVIQKAAINAETTQGRHTELFSCDRCPTDYSVVVDGDDASLRLGMTWGMDARWKIQAGRVTSYQHGTGGSKD